MSKLKDHVAVVTGATGGIGGAIAAAIAREGATVCMTGRDPAKLENGVGRLREDSLRAESCPMDLTRDEDVERLAAHVAQQFGRLDILVHCAGAIDHGKLEHAPLAAFDRQYAANV